MKSQALNAFIILFIQVVSPVVAAAQPIENQDESSISGDNNWVRRYLLPGIDNTVYSTTVDNNGRLYVVGRSRNAGEVKVNGVACWSGKSWFGMGLETSVWNLPSIKNTSYFTDCTWSNGELFVLMKNTDGGYLISWNGNKWAIRDTISEDAILSSNNTNSGFIYTKTINDETRIVQFQNGKQLIFPGKFNSIPRSIIIDNNGYPIVGGERLTINNESIDFIVRWNGNDWEKIDNQLHSCENNNVLGMAYYRDTIYALTVSGCLFRWDGDNWKELLAPSQFTISRNPITVDSSGCLYVVLNANDGTEDNFVAQWKNNEWTIINNKIVGSITSITPVSNDKFYISGELTSVDTLPILNIAFWDGSRWSQLKSEKEIYNSYGFSIKDLEVNNKDIYICGSLNEGANDEYYIAAWNKESWKTIDRGAGEVNGIVRHPNGSILAYGSFINGRNLISLSNDVLDLPDAHPITAAASSSKEMIVATYDNKANNSFLWKINVLGEWTLLTNNIQGKIYSIAINDNSICIGGSFDSINKISIKNIALFKNNLWHAIAEGFGEYYTDISVVAFLGESIIAGGNFTYIEPSLSTNHIAIWNGGKWESMGEGLSGHNRGSVLHNMDYTQIKSIIVRGHEVFVGGYFYDFNTKIEMIAVWDTIDKQWSSLGSGTNYEPEIVNSLFIQDSMLFVGGNMFSVGNQPTRGLAIWKLDTKKVFMSLSTKLINYGSIVVGNSFEQTLVITNPSTSTRTLAGKLKISGSPYFIKRGSKGFISADTSFNIAPGTNMKLPIVFSPEVSGISTGKLLITYNSTEEIKEDTVVLTGNATPRSVFVKINPKILNFGKVQIGDTVYDTVKIMNYYSSNSSILINQIKINKPFGFFVSPNAIQIYPDSVIALIVKFSPDGIGLFSEKMIIRHNANYNGDSVIILLQGMGIQKQGILSSNKQKLLFNNNVKFDTLILKNSIRNGEDIYCKIAPPVKPFNLVNSKDTIVTIIANDSVLIPIKIDTFNLSEYTDTLNIYHNIQNQSNPLQILLINYIVSDVESHIDIIDKIDMQVHPNLITTISNIQLQMPITSYVQLSLNNTSGEAVAVIVEGILSAGSHEFKININHLPSGLYYCTVKTLSSSISQKVIILK